MTTHFAEVLARESACLAEVTDGTQLDRWRHRIVGEIMTPRSPYSLALRQTGDLPERADFLARWRRLIADTVDRLLQSRDTASSSRRSRPPRREDVDPEKTAILILAALHGGSSLSQVAQDPWPLNAALDIALAPFASENSSRGDTTPRRPDQ